MPTTRLDTDLSPTGEAVRQGNLRAVESFFARMRAKDIDGWIQLWAEDGKILIPYPPQGAGFPPRIEGRDNILAGFRQLFAHFERYDCETLGTYPSVDPNYIVVEWSVRAHLTTGLVYRGENITVFRFRDGLIAEYHDYFNPELFRPVVEAIK
jgi:ketosteroid isomerase-like protein